MGDMSVYLKHRINNMENIRSDCNKNFKMWLLKESRNGVELKPKNWWREVDTDGETGIGAVYAETHL